MDGSLKSSDLSLEVLGGASHNKVSELKEENINYDSDNEFGSIDLNFDDKDCLSGIDSSIDECFNDKGPPLDDDIIDAIGSENNLITLSQKEDNIFSEIKDFITRRKSGSRSQSSLTNSDSTTHVRTSSQFSSIPYGIIPKASYEHGNMCSDIMGVTYNNRMRQFIILDAKGITTWKRDAVDHRVNRVLEYPKYEYKLITHLVYAKKHNCYFGLGKDFSLKVFNRDFMETCSVSADLRSVLFMLFNPVRDELITGGVGGTKVWQFHQQAGKAFGSLRPLGNYGLTLKQELPNVGGGWVKRVDLDYNLEHLYCCSDTGLHVYDLDGKEILKFESAHSMTITGCRYSQYANFLVTCSVDCEVKVWSVLGGLVHTFRGHSRAVTSLMLHPATSSIVITCSLDGSIRMWSLDTMECHYSIVVSVDGVLWMGQTDDNILYLCTARTLTLWNINYCVQFCAHARSNVTSLSCCGGKDKTTRLMVISEDSSVRLMARSNMKNMSTVLPPPSISPLQKVMSVCYSRQRNTMYLLIDPYEIWVYTTRTDPACRIAVWDVSDLQRNFISTKTAVDKVEDVSSPARTTFNKPPPSHRATEGGSANQPIANCCCLAVLNSDAIFWSAQGKSCTEQDVFLLLGLEDGRILFMDPVVKAQKYLEFKTGKDAVLDISHDVNHNSLHTLYKVKGMMLVHIWNLPDLELQNEVYMAPDLEAYTRLDNSLFTGYTSGCVLFHSLEKVKDIGLNKARMLPNVEDVVETHHKPEHLAPITTVDVCISLKLFCSCSNDGAIKIWTEDGSLLTEIMLDSSLTTACFLNNMGDLVIGFQKHLFFIDHSKIYSQMVVPESDMDTFDKESVIYEDPAVMYEGIIPYPDPITLENYLVPFDIEFSKDFFEGKVELEPQSLKPVEIERASRASMAPTEIYVSPDATPRRRLSLVDLTVDSSVTNGDLADFMHKTIEHMEEKDKRDMRQMHFELKRESESRSSALRRKLRVKLKLINAGNKKDAPPKEQATKKKQAEQLKFSFPRFGKSPGPTPESSSPPTPDLMSEPEDLLEEDTLKSKMELTSQMTDHHFEKVEDDEISRFLKSDKEPKPEEKAKFVPAAPRKKFGFSDVTVDAKLLMKDVVKSNPKTPLASGQRGRVIELSQPKKVDPDSTTVEKKTRKERAMKVKKTAEPSSRRHSKQKQQKEDQNEPPPTQMQALELKELQLTVSGETSLANVEEPQINDTEEDDLVTEDKEFEEAIEDGAFSGMPSMMSDYTVKMTVPDLPSIPSEPNVKDSPKLTAAESKALLMSKLDRRSAIDFVGVSKGEHTKGGQKGSPEDVAKSHEKTGASRLELPVDSLTSRYQEGGQGSAAGHQLRVSSNEQQRSTDSIGELKSPKVHVTPSVQFEGTKPNEGNRSGSFSKERLASSSLDDRKSSVQDVFISRTAPTSHTWAVPRKTTQNSFESQGTPYIQSNTPLLSEFSYNHLNPMTPETYFEDEEVQIIRESSHDAASIVDQSERHGSLSDTVWPDQFSMSITRQPSQPDDPRQADKQNVGANVNYQSADLLSLSEASQAGTQSKALVEENLLGRSAVQTGLATKSESPPTAKVRFHPEDLQAAFENSILSYQSMARSGLISDKLYKNDDQAFAENWHERQIERHMLIRMQKKLRTLNVHKKRQLLEHMKQERLKEHVLNDHMTDKTRTTIAPSLYQRATTVHGTRPTISIPVPTPMSSRPHTAAGNYNSGRALVPQPQQFQQQQQQQGSPLSLHQQIHQALDQRARQQEVELTQKEKSELGLKKSFRFTMRPTKDASSKFGGTSDPSPELDPWLLDPRNPQAFRPKSSKSIPSKCHQYVLITKPKTPLITPLPTPLEEQLLAARFPDQGEKVYKQYEGLLFRPPRRPMYGIGYSPYEHQLYG